MALKYTELRELAFKVAKADKSAPVAYEFNGAKYSHDDLENALRAEFQELAGDFNKYRRNKLTIFELMQETIDEIMPNRIITMFGQFAEIRQFRQGQKQVFKRPLGRVRGKQFITKVGLTGIYETFRLDSTTFEVQSQAWGGAAQIELERFLDGTVNFNDLLMIMEEGMEDALYNEVQTALINSTAGMPAANQAAVAGFDYASMIGIINTVKSYGNGATLFCSPDFAAKITNNPAFTASTTDNDEMRNQGYIGVIAGARIVVLPQSFTDETNTVKVLDPAYCYVLPTGGQGTEKIVKIAFEGQTIVDETKNADQSREIQSYKKFGVGILQNNYFGVYEDTTL